MTNKTCRWTPEQIKQFQDYWDPEFAGDLAKRRRAKFVPGDSASTGRDAASLTVMDILAIL